MVAQAQYYQERGGGEEVWAAVLHPATKPAPQPSSPDTISLQSCPTAHSSSCYSFQPHHHRTQSACLPGRRRPAPRPAEPATNPLSSSQPSLAPQSPPLPRPHSLYVPFVGCVDAPRAPPGQAARDILHALSFAPTQESFSPPAQPTPSSRLSSYRKILSSKSPKLRSKSSSLASLIGPISPKLSRRQEPLSSSASSLASSVPRPSSPCYSPCHPGNHCENNILSVTHPPVVQPPPDLVQSSTPGPPPPLSRLSSQSFSSCGSGWETGRSSGHSSHSPLVIPRSSQSPLMFDYQNPSQLLQSQLEMIRESSPYHSSS